MVIINRSSGCNGAGAAERNYPTSKVRGGSREELLTSKVGVVAERSYPTSKVRSSGCTLLEQP